MILPDDEILKEQLVNRKWRRTSDGKLLLESKEDLKRRGGHSPDRADAVLGAMMPAAASSIAPINYTIEDEDDTNVIADEDNLMSELGIQI